MSILTSPQKRILSHRFVLPEAGIDVTTQHPVTIYWRPGRWDGQARWWVVVEDSWLRLPTALEHYNVQPPGHTTEFLPVPA